MLTPWHSRSMTLSQSSSPLVMISKSTNDYSKATRLARRAGGHVCKEDPIADQHSIFCGVAYRSSCPIGIQVESENNVRKFLATPNMSTRPTSLTENASEPAKCPSYEIFQGQEPHAGLCDVQQHPRRTAFVYGDYLHTK
jgi:hypothetical protein